MSSTLFRCKTQDAYVLKSLFELLQTNIKMGCFEIWPSHIALRMTDSNHKILIDLRLEKENFGLYTYSSDLAYISVGINLIHMYKMMKSIKKKDSVCFFLDKERITDIGIQVIPRDHTRMTVSYVKIQNLRNLGIELPPKADYTHSILISSAEFYKMCKEIGSISNTIRVTARQHSVLFSCDLDSIYSKQIMLGDEDDTPFAGSVFFEDDFETDFIQRIVKVASLKTSLTLRFAHDLPLWIESGVGSLGKISIYMKSRKHLAEHGSDIPGSEL